MKKLLIMLLIVPAIAWGRCMPTDVMAATMTNIMNASPVFAGNGVYVFDGQEYEGFYTLWTSDTDRFWAMTFTYRDQSCALVSGEGFVASYERSL